MSNPEQQPSEDSAKSEQQGLANLERDKQLSNPPSIYVASLSDYNAGVLHGAWIDATQDLETIDTQISDMLFRSQEPGAEETAIHDYEGFGAWRPSEYERLETVTTVAQAIAKHGEAVTHWIDYLGEPPDQSIASFGDAYLGGWETMRDYAAQLADDVGVEVTVDPPSWQHYAPIDFDAVASDLEIDLYSDRGGDGTLHVFDPGRVE